MTGPGISRRALLTGGSIVGSALVGGAIGATVAHEADSSGSSSTTESTEPFWGAHQSGVLTDTQRHVVLAAFDLTTTSRSDVASLLQAWTALAGALAAGRSTTIPAYTGTGSGTNAYADATGTASTDDSLEAWQLGPQRLTVTVGFGPTLFTKNGTDRYGLAGRRPAALVDLPRFAGDEIVEDESGGDLLLQVCADDSQVAFHAVRSIARIAPDVATLKWTQLGYSPSNTGGTPRNLMGFKDGTINSNVHHPTDLAATLWAGADGPTWMRDGTYLVYRRIRITLEHWDRLGLSAQQQVVGRTKVAGAPLSGGHEFDALDLEAKAQDGTPAIPVNAHVRLAAPATNNGAIIVRRAFSYNNGTTPFVERWPPWRQALEYDAGLLFLGFQRDPRNAFIPVNRRLSETDAMNQFTTHTATGIYAVPPAASAPGDWLGRPLFS